MSRLSQRPDNLPTPETETREAPAEWIESLEISEAQLARGETVPLDPVLERLRATIARMEARRSGTGKQ
jgi:hypothetical protein